MGGPSRSQMLWGGCVQTQCSTLEERGRRERFMMTCWFLFQTATLIAEERGRERVCARERQREAEKRI
jgi:hypothetical protein